MAEHAEKTITALVVGATGLVGKELVALLLRHLSFGKVVAFVRRSSGTIHPRLEEHVVNFDEPSTWSHLVAGDILFSALGTTIRDAGSQEAQYRVDHHYQFAFAKAAANNGVSKYVLVSSVGANASSSFFYTRMKGELERDVQKLGFKQIDLMQPSLLDGERAKKRILEKVSIAATSFLNKVGILKKYRPVKGEVVAAAMVHCALRNEPGVHTWRPESIHDLGISFEF